MNERDEFDDARLNRLLDEARWPEPDETRLARLRFHWRRLRLAGCPQAGTRRAQWAAVATCLAASLLIAAAAMFWRTDAPVAKVSTMPNDTSFAPDEAPSHSMVVSSPDRTVRGREPNVHERTILLAQSPMPRAQSHAKVAATVAATVKHLSAPRSSSREAPPAVAKSPVAPVILPVAAPAPPVDDRQRHLASLLERGTVESLTEYLDYLRDPAMRDLALAAASASNNAPLDLWIVELDDPRPARRLEAVLVLGRMPNPEIVRRLGPSLLERAGRQEATMALLLNPTPQSARFVDEARRNVYLIATVQAAERQLASLSTFDGVYSP